MNKLAIYTGIFLSLPLVASAQTLQNFLTNLMNFLGGPVVQLLLVIAFLFFVVNVVRYFVIGGSNEEGQEKARALAVYSVAAFVLIIIFWGLVNFLSDSIGLKGETMPTPDYIENAALQNPTCEPGQTSVCSDVLGATVCRCR